MNSAPKRKSNTKEKLFRPLSYDNFSLSDEKRIKPDILTSYLNYKKYFNKFNVGFQNFMNPFSFIKKNNTSNLLLSMKNLINKNTKKQNFYKQRKIHINNNNKYRNNKIKNKRMYFNTKKENNYENKFKSKYKLIMRNLSYNGNSKISFKNLSNDILDDLFQEKHFNSYFIPTLQKTPIFQKKSIKFNYENFNNKNNNNINIYINENNKNNYINKKYTTYLSYLNNNTILNKKSNDNYNEEKKGNNDLKILKNEFNTNNNISENNHYTSATSARGKNQEKKISSFNKEYKNKKIIIKSKTGRKIKFESKFQILKMGLRKQNDVNSKLINNIKKEQSLSKYKIQVGIVQLNGYRPKNRQLKNTK